MPNRFIVIPLISLAGLLAMGAPAFAQGTLPPGGNAAQSIDCAGGDAAVTGDGKQVMFHGSCRSLTVQGNGNQIRAELAPRARLDVRGDGNSVRYRLIGGTEEAQVTVAGQHDVVGPDAAPLAGEGAPATKAPLTLASGTPAEGNCTDRDVTISADDASYTLHGGCRSITVTGSRTTVHAEMQPQSRITVSGPNNKVFWFLQTSGAPPVSDVTGANSQVLQQQRLGTVIAPASAGPVGTGDQPSLVLGGSTAVVEERCGGRDVQITADNTVFVLRDRCRTLSVTGNGNTVEAELLAGSRIRIEGDHSLVQFMLTETGADPIVSVNGEKSAAYRVQRLGATSRGDASVGVSPTAGGMKVDGGAGASVTEMHAVPQPKE